MPQMPYAAIINTANTPLLLADGSVRLLAEGHDIEVLNERAPFSTVKTMLDDEEEYGVVETQFHSPP